MRNYFLIWVFICQLLGCANQPTVCVYAKYLDDKQKAAVVKAFEQSNEYQVELNELDFPASVSQNTLLYSLMINDPTMIERASLLTDSLGFTIQRTQALTQGNHWYTKNAIALFLLPTQRDKTRGLFKQDLVHVYSAQRCGDITALSLTKEGTYQLFTETVSSERKPFDGTWSYRQYPYLELRKQGANDADFYFEIKQYRSSDIVSDISFIELISLNAGLFPEGCSFIIGTRL